MRNAARHNAGRSAIEAVAVTGVPFVFVACAQMLGIDGKYVADDQIGPVSAGGAADFPRDAQNFPPLASAGGVTFTASGGLPGSGGSTTGGVPVGNGGIPIGAMNGGAGVSVAPPVDSGTTCSTCPPPVATCPSGTYVGTMSGRHSASILAGFRLPIEGTVTFSVAPGAVGAHATVSGAIDGNATIAPNSFATFAATLTGSVDCRSGVLKGTISGTYGVAPAPVPFEGTHEGALANGVFEGTWSEHETSNPSMSQYYGNGTWSAASAGP